MTKVQAIIYKQVDGNIECLCLKRSIEDGGFWHVLTGTIEGNEAHEECLESEIKEELGDVEITSVSPILKKWDWNKDGNSVAVLYCAVKVSSTVAVILNSEHDEFVWLGMDEARRHYEKESAKEMVTLLRSYLDLP